MNFISNFKCSDVSFYCDIFLKRSQSLLTFCTVSMALLQTYIKQSSVTVSKNFRKWEGKLLAAASVYLYPFCFVGSIAMWGKPNYPCSSLFCQLLIIHFWQTQNAWALSLLCNQQDNQFTFQCSLICFCNYVESIWL